jgi:hypothetical protein
MPFPAFVTFLALMLPKAVSVPPLNNVAEFGMIIY